MSEWKNLGPSAYRANALPSELIRDDSQTTARLLHPLYTYRLRLGLSKIRSWPCVSFNWSNSSGIIIKVYYYFNNSYLMRYLINKFQIPMFSLSWIFLVCYTVNVLNVRWDFESKKFCTIRKSWISLLLFRWEMYLSWSHFSKICISGYRIRRESVRMLGISFLGYLNGSSTRPPGKRMDLGLSPGPEKIFPSWLCKKGIIN